jgi:hypothetical protein
METTLVQLFNEHGLLITFIGYVITFISLTLYIIRKLDE